ncbi:MAG: bifunctional adenosylcobinamide kinase/adenosylcobinamide-phosphate guanylyltransferase [Candidatus Nanopelagicales bacterium]
MRVTLLGTGAADGIPQPFCGCATCTDARGRGEVRAPGGVLVDQELLIDPGPGAAGAAARAGVDLSRVTTIAVTHAHADHWDPSILLFRQWRTDDGAGLPRLRLIGPAGVIGPARDWLAPTAAVDLIPARPGDTWSLGTRTLRALPSTHGRAAPGAPTDPLAAEAVLFEVRDSAGAAMLYAADTGPPSKDLLNAVAGAGYGLALIELTFGAGRPTTPGHLDHATFPTALADLRACGALTPTTEVVAIHIGHHNPPAHTLHSVLESWGARAVADGTTLAIGQGGGPKRAEAPTRTVLVTGGARSGKSSYAEQTAGAAADVLYLATGWPRGVLGDADWDARLDTHVARRPARWRTREWNDPTPADLGAAVAAAPPGSTVLIDCLALWVTRLLEGAVAWDDPERAADVVARGCEALLSGLTATSAAEVVLVTNEVGSGVVPATAAGRAFRDQLGTVNARVAERADAVFLVVAGRALELTAQSKDADA